jgi:hypothetical protein
MCPALDSGVTFACILGVRCATGSLGSAALSWADLIGTEPDKGAALSTTP